MNRMSFYHVFSKFRRHVQLMEVRRPTLMPVRLFLPVISVLTELR